MSVRELVVLGTAAQVPTRTRSHNSCLLRWDGEGLLLDPGEGTQRQLTLAGIAASQITRIAITHFHGDHCLGLPGVIQRLSLDRAPHAVDVWFPASGREYLDRLRSAAAFAEQVEIRPHPVDADGVVDSSPAFTLSAVRLDHRIETFGWRIAEPDGVRMLPDRLAAAGVHGPDIGRLLRDGSIRTDGRVVRLEEVSETRRGQVVAFVMDTRQCDAAVELARGADLLVCESTFLSADEALAEAYAHLTAAQAARLAKDAGARRLVLTHFSQRYPDETVFLAEAAAIFPDVIAARDLMRVPLPRRRPGRAGDT